MYKFGKVIAWILIFGAVIVGYAFRFELEYVATRTLGVLVPGYSYNSSGQLSISRSSDGHFYVDAVINNTKIKFMIDTGASDVALSDSDAKKLNLGKLYYTKKYSTANGVSASAPVVLSSIKIGEKTFYKVNAGVSKLGSLDNSLLGMSVISRFKSFQIDRDILVLKY